MSGWGLSATKSRLRWRPWPFLQDPPWRDNLFITLIVILIALTELPTSNCQNFGVSYFDPPQATVSFSEGSIIGSRLLLEPAKIQPGSEYVISSYSIVGGNEESRFRLHETKGQENVVGTLGNSGNWDRGVSYVHLETLKSLDRESTASYLLNISATATSSSQSNDLFRSNLPTGYLSLRVNVLDINDNPPIFTKNEYVSNLNETLEVGTEFLQVVANDPDAGKNGRLTYHITHPDNYASHFALHPDTGWMRTRASLRCRTKRQVAENRCLPCLSDPSRRGPCSLTIVARDGGAPQQSSQTVVKVRLLDTNNHSPKVSFRFHSAAGSAIAGINEDAKPGTLVAAVSVTDSDAGRHGETTTQIIGGNGDRNFLLDGSNIIRVAERAKLTRGKVYKLTVKATDLGLPPRSSTSSLSIRVNEVNDHPPQFEKTIYKTSLPENSLPGSKVLEISATDMDNNKIGANGGSSGNGLVYRIVDGNKLGWFSIHPNSGMITTSQVLDRETKEDFLLTVTAEDRGISPKTVTTTVSVQLLDVNDNAPTFASMDYLVNVSESLPLKKSFFSKAIASDPDKGENGTLSYHLVTGYDNIFGINQRSGEVYILSSLDREQKDFYELKIVAKDQGKIQFSSSTQLKVNVMDANDNLPIFYPKEYFVRIPSVLESKSFRLPLATPLVSLQASDKDADLNSKIEFNWDTSNAVTQNYLRLNSDTGEIFPTRSFSISYENILNQKSGVESVKIYATDGGGKRSLESAAVYLFSNTRQINEKGRQLFQEKSLTFSIVEDNGLSDGKETSFVSRQGIDDNFFLNYCKTMFRFSNMTKSYDQTRNGKVGYVPSNPDIDVKFTIAEGDPFNIFSIEENSGQILTQKTLDRESKSMYNFTVVGRTTASPFTFDSAQVIINIEDLNDQVPTFTPDDLEVDVLYLQADSPIGHKIHRVACIDKDDGINGRLIFELSVEGDVVNSMFGIDPISGVISLVSKVPDTYYPNDQDDAEIYSVKVVVTDSGLSPFPLSNSRTYDIQIIRKNTHTPIFDYTHSEISVSEEMPLNTEIITLAAIDNDVGPAGQIIYSIVEDFNHRGKFGIFPDGRVYLKDYLDRETQAYHSIRVKAQDFGTPSRSSDATVVIYVMDENDNDPVLIPRLNSKGEDSYIFYLAENEPGNSVVGRISAVDADI